MKIVNYLVISAVLFLSGCTTMNFYTYGKDFDETKRTQIVKGQSTQSDVLKLYGEPNDKNLENNNQETWTYFYRQEQNQLNLWTYNTKGNVRLKKLLIAFDDKNIVQNFVYSDTTNPTSSK